MEKPFPLNEGGCREVMKKKGKKKMPTHTKTESHSNPIPTSLFLSILSPFYVGSWVSVCIVLSQHILKKATAKQRRRDGVMNDFLSLCR